MNEKEIYEQNELVANKTMASVSVIIAGLLFVFWLLCMLGVNIFSFTQTTLMFIKVSFPIDCFFLSVPLFFRFIKPDFLKKPWFKYLVVSLLVLAISGFNFVLPKQGMLLWTVVIIVAALYFNTRITKFAFIMALAFMIIVFPLSAIYGDWDSNIMCIAKEEFVTYFRADGITHLDPDSKADRIYWLNNFIEITGKPQVNRWISLYGFFLLPRVLTFVIVFLFGNALSKRTKYILQEQVIEAKSVQKMSSELSIASAIQSSCLPSEFPNSSRCELFAMMDPVKEVGGDFYDFFKVDADHAVLVIGDVSGKGIPASLFMMKSQAVINALAHSIKNDPALIFETANQTICNGNDLNMFVTCWLGILDLNSGELTYTSAGHNPPIVKKNGKYSYLKTKTGFVLGGFTESKYINNTIKLEKGDKLFIYTDGVTEAHNKNEELYGEDRLLNFFEVNDPSPVEGIMKIRESIRVFADGADQFDDITMLMIEDHKPQSVYMKKFPALKEKLSEVQEFVIDSIKNIDLQDKDKNMLNIVIEEIFINVASYSFEEFGKVDVAVNSQDNTLTLVFIDDGKPFNPLERDDPNIKAGAEERGVGGLGIFMVKNMMDKVYYDYKDGRNILTLIKED